MPYVNSFINKLINFMEQRIRKASKKTKLYMTLFNLHLTIN